MVGIHLWLRSALSTRGLRVPALRLNLGKPIHRCQWAPWGSGHLVPIDCVCH